MTKTVYGDPSLVAVFDARLDHPARMAAPQVARVLLRGSGRRCTAFLVSPSRGVMLTASHCLQDIAEPSQVNLEFQGLESTLRFAARHVVVNDRLDVAFVYLSVDGTKYARGLQGLKLDPAWEGRPKYPSPAVVAADYARLYMVGFPSGEPLSVSFDCGLVRQTVEIPDRVGVPLAGCDCDASGGNSGSPVFDANTSSVVGVFWGGQPDTQSGLSAAYEGPFELFVRLRDVAGALTNGSGTDWLEKADDMEQSAVLARELGFAFERDKWQHRSRLAECALEAGALARSLGVVSRVYGSCFTLALDLRSRNTELRELADKHYSDCESIYYEAVDDVAAAIPNASLGNDYNSDKLRLELDGFSGCANEFALPILSAGVSE